MRAILAAIALLALSLAALLRPELPSTPAPPSPVSAPAPVAAAQHPDVRPDPSPAVAAILARPLFRPDRRPLPADKASPDAAPAASTTLPCLRGTIVSGQDAVALFGTPPDVQARRTGEMVGGAWRVATIAPGGTTLDGPGGRIATAVSFCDGSRPAIRTVTAPAPAPMPAGVNELGDYTPPLPAGVRNPTAPVIQPRRR